LRSIAMRIAPELGKPAIKNKQIEDEFWTHYVADPRRWWINHFDKINPRAPDFRHKVTHKGLWIQSKNTSDWVRKRFL
jgi:hypothetical protein